MAALRPARTPLWSFTFTLLPNATESLQPPDTSTACTSPGNNLPVLICRSSAAIIDASCESVA